MYCMRRPDGRLVIGGARSHDPAAAGSRGGAVVSGAGDDDSVGSDAAADRLKEFLSQLLANFGETLVVEKEWTGVMGFTQDSKPLVGPVPEGLLHGGLAAGSVFVGAGFVRATYSLQPPSPPLPDPEPSQCAERPRNARLLWRRQGPGGDDGRRSGGGGPRAGADAVLPRAVCGAGSGGRRGRHRHRAPLAVWLFCRLRMSR